VSPNHRYTENETQKNAEVEEQKKIVTVVAGIEIVVIKTLNNKTKENRRRQSD
jgi:hypothetical protein